MILKIHEFIFRRNRNTLIPEKKRKSEDFKLNQRRILQQLKRIAGLAVLPFCFAAVPAAGICLSLPVAVLDVSAAAAVIHFDGNGGSGSMADYTLKDGKGTLPANVFTKKGYVFKGWAEDPSAVDYKYEDHASVSIASRVTLYALWEPKMYIVHFDKNGADYGKMPDTYALYDDSVDPGENMFLRFGYNFAGWEDERGNKYGISEAIPTLSDGDTVSRKVITLDAGKPKNIKYSFRSTQGSVVFKENGRMYAVTAAGINDSAYYKGDLSHYETVVTKYDLETGKAVARARNLKIDHGNGICYNPDNGHIYIAEGGTLKKYPSGVMELDRNLKKVKDWKFPLLSHIWAIAYNDGHFYVIGKNDNSRNSFCVLNTNMQTLSISDADGYYGDTFSSQGIAADDNFIYAVSASFKSYEWKSKQRINVFTHDGAYIGCWQIDIPYEAEDITVIDGTAYINTNEKQYSSIYKVELPSVTLKAVWKKAGSKKR